jgi:hypothetical protein
MYACRECLHEQKTFALRLNELLDPALDSGYPKYVSTQIRKYSAPIDRFVISREQVY